MACTEDSETVALSITAGVLEADVKISATAGNRASANADGIYVGGDFIETGDYVWSARTTKAGFLICDEAAVSRSTYAGLFAIIGTTYGAGDGSTTFNVPPAPGRTLVAKGTHTSVDALGKTEGIIVVANRSPKHNSTVNDPGHTHTGGGSGGAVDSYSDISNSVQNHSLPLHTTGITVGPGGTLPVDTPAFLVANLFIKT